MKTTVLVAALSLSSLAHADPAAWYGESNCKIAPIQPAPRNNAVKWSGACKDGYADGKGVLEWEAGDGKRKLEATLAHGDIAGEGTMTGKFGKYIGTFKHGQPDGQGYFKFTNGKQYEGGVAQDKFEGPGIAVDLDRSRYEGEWKNDKRHGYGKQVYALGGSYEGEWKNGLFDGKGVIVYAGSGRRYEGLFKEGRPVGSAPAAAAEPGRYTLAGDDRIGSHITAPAVVANRPIDGSWEQLTPGQQRAVKDLYKALEEGDEPPYPVHGTRKLYSDISKIRNSGQFSNEEGTLLAYVLVGKDGNPVSVKSMGELDPEFVRYIGTTLMLQEFKPARCHGEPCEMIYPTNLSFTFD